MRTDTKYPLLQVWGYGETSEKSALGAHAITAYDQCKVAQYL